MPLTRPLMAVSTARYFEAFTCIDAHFTTDPCRSFSYVAWESRHPFEMHSSVFFVPCSSERKLQPKTDLARRSGRLKRQGVGQLSRPARGEALVVIGPI